MTNSKTEFRMAWHVAFKNRDIPNHCNKKIYYFNSEISGRIRKGLAVIYDQSFELIEKIYTNMKNTRVLRSNLRSLKVKKAP